MNEGFYEMNIQTHEHARTHAWKKKAAQVERKNKILICNLFFFLSQTIL